MSTSTIRVLARTCFYVGAVAVSSSVFDAFAVPFSGLVSAACFVGFEFTAFRPLGPFEPVTVFWGVVFGFGCDRVVPHWFEEEVGEHSEEEACAGECSNGKLVW